MRSFDADTLAAMAKDGRVIRELVFVDNGTNSFGFWNGPDDASISVVGLSDGVTVSRTYVGSGSLVDAGVAVTKVGLEVRTINVVLSGVHSGVVDMVRGYDVRGASIETHKVLFDVSTGEVVAVGYGYFMGVVDGTPINTPDVGGEGDITLRCVSHVRELTLVNTSLKSDETQKLRSGDRFYQDVGVVGDWPIIWGEVNETANTVVPEKTGWFGWGWGPF